MISEDEDGTRWHPLLPGSRSAGTRYGFAVVAALAGVLVTAALFQTTVSDQPIYAPMIGAVVLTAWYGGFGPSLLTIALGWSAALWLFVDTHPWLSGGSENVTRWWINLVVVLVIAGLGGLLRMRGERAAADASSARDAVREIESLQRLAVALAGALSPADVAHVVTGNAAEIVSAHGVALALVDGDELAVVDPTGLAAEGRSDGDRLALEDSSLLTRAVRDGEVVTAAGREELEVDFHDTATTLPNRVEGAIAVPLWSRDRVVGALGFLFERAEAVGDETVALAVIMGDLTGQALERARLYERESESRAALDRILQVAPRFLADDADDAIQAICREARTTFGADYGVLWRIHDDDLVLLAIDPPQRGQSGTHLSLEDFPQLRGAMLGLEASFVPDVLQTTSRDGLRFVRELGIRSSLRTPIVIAGVARAGPLDLLAGRDLGAGSRRRSSSSAASPTRRVSRWSNSSAAARKRRWRSGRTSTRRLQDVTAALSRATTIVEVSNTCLEHALASVGAEAGFVVLNGPEGTTVEIVTSSGYDDDELAAWRELGLDCRCALRTGDLLGRAGVGPVAGGDGRLHGRCRSLARRAGSRSRCTSAAALVAPFTCPCVAPHAQRERAGMAPGDGLPVQSGAGAKLRCTRRSGGFASVRSACRASTASLSNALTPATSPGTSSPMWRGGLEATEVGIVAVTDDGKYRWRSWPRKATVGRGLASAGSERGDARRLGHPCASIRVVRVAGGGHRGVPRGRRQLARTGAKSFLLVPLVAARRTNALLVASWRHSQRLSRDDRSLVEALAGTGGAGARPRTPLRVGADDRRDAAAQRLAGLAATRRRSAAGGALPARDGRSRRRRRLVRRDLAARREARARRRRRCREGRPGRREHGAAPKRHTRLLRRAAEAAVRARPPEPARERRARHLVRDCRLPRARSGDRGVPSCVGGPSAAARRVPRTAASSSSSAAAACRWAPGLQSKYRQQTVELPAGRSLSCTPTGSSSAAAGPSTTVSTRSFEQSASLRRTLTGSSSTSSIASSGAGSGKTTSRFSPPACCRSLRSTLDLSVPADIRSMELIRDAMRAWLDGLRRRVRRRRTSSSRPGKRARTGSSMRWIRPASFLVRAELARPCARRREDTGTWLLRAAMIGASAHHRRATRLRSTDRGHGLTADDRESLSLVARTVA